MRRKSSTFVKAGLPFVIFVVGGSLGLSQFMGGKYLVQDRRMKSQSTQEFNLEEEHKKLMQKISTDDFEVKPIPKPPQM